MKKTYEAPLMEEFAVLTENVMSTSAEDGFIDYGENDNETGIAYLLGLLG